jgi:hypothetical protein
MKRFILGFAALALLLVATETANAQSWRVGGWYGGGYPVYSATYGTRVGDSGFLTASYSSGYPVYSYPAYSYGYPTYGYSYGYPRYAYTYSTPYYSTPMYYSTPYYYSGPSIGYSYYGGGRGWRGWRW